MFLYLTARLNYSKTFFRSIATLFHGNKSSGNDFFLSGFGVIFSIRIQDGVSDLHRPTATDEWKEAEQNEDDGDLNIKKVRKCPRVLIHPVKQQGMITLLVSPGGVM